MKAWMEGNSLHIVAPLDQGTASRSGRTMIVASTHGNRSVEDSEYDGRPVYFNLNVIQFADEAAGSPASEPEKRPRKAA